MSENHEKIGCIHPTEPGQECDICASRAKAASVVREARQPAPRVDASNLIAAAERYMLSVKALGQQSGYNKLTYFEAPIIKMPTPEMQAEAHDRWMELNNAGKALTAACEAQRSAAIAAGPSPSRQAEGVTSPCEFDPEGFKKYAALTTSPEPDAVREALDKRKAEIKTATQDHGWTNADTAWHRAFGELSGLNYALEELRLAALSRPAHGGWEDVIEQCAKIADDHTPRKYEGTLAAHVAGSTIANAIRALARNDRGSEAR